ncbi:zinc finger protein 800 [Pieris napi]|uniref:zinc finger protein 800 n=1 Tax=Pieris napi TaxID=78633 RepID=UPI001FBABF24|nr:zinc finger protein 800 [Pieris napi]XP_047526009.1 zinc finger protein 800 [Pieris napi]XP_047526010.1 zinc finger protein 800 [Pieris napi]
MAGDKGSTKPKSKEIKNRTNKNAVQNSEDAEDIDYSLLRRPLTTSVTGFAQARKVFDSATEEVREILSKECNMIYECKVCTNLFRSLANFISHKRVYCAEKCSSVYTNFETNSSTKCELLKIKRFEENYQEFLKENLNINTINTEDERIPLSRDLTAVVEKIATTKGVPDEKNNQQNVVLEKIPKSSVAVYQTLQLDSNEDAMSTQVTELDNILSKENAVMQSDGNFKVQNNSEEIENVIQISDDEDNSCMQQLKCRICDQQFSTRKTFKFHVKTKHEASRLVYPCPDCLEIFSTSWSVYRHLFKVHRKTAAQIRRLRDTIQSKAFHMNNPPASYEKRKANAKPVTSLKITDEERLEQENQAWMDNMEGDGELPRCGGCGRTFERRAALAAHTNTCQPRSRALARRPDAKKIEIQIRKDYNKGATVKEKTTNEVVPPVSKPTPQKEDTETRNESLTEAIMSIVGVAGPEVEEDSSIEKPDLNMDVIKPVHILPFCHQAEKSNFNVLKLKVMQNVILEDLSCKKCENKFKEPNELFDHVAGHYNWVRYACKLCKFRHYEYEMVSDHVKVVHKLKGDAEFYFSTIKAIDGTEATHISEPKDITETSPNSRRPSRCSSDSSKLSDDSSSSSTPIEVGSRKRKVNAIRAASKKKKAFINDDGDGDSKDSEPSPQKDSIQIENDSSNSIGFNENSSDVDDSEEKGSKRIKIDYVSSSISRRPIRKRTIPKNKDFEYDLSNLLKMQMHGYKESHTNSNIKSAQAKKKSQQDFINNYNALNKDCSGAMTTLSRQSVAKNKAHMITTDFAVYSNNKDQRISNIFVRPMLPKIVRGDKISPSKEQTSKTEKDITNISSKPLEAKESVHCSDILDKPIQPKQKVVPETPQNINTEEDCETPNKNVRDEIDFTDGPSKPSATVSEKPRTNVNLVPIKLHKHGLDLIKNPLIKKNISDFSKAGMKTKILVIKHINKNDGTPSIKTPLKIKRIKINETQSIKNDSKKTDPLVVVKVPSAETVIPPIPVSNNNNTSDNDQEMEQNSEIKERNESQEDTNKNNTICNEETSINKISIPETDTNEVVTALL